MAITPAREKPADRAVYLAVTAAVERLGRHDFYDRLLDLIGLQVPHDLAALVRYSKSARPDLILPRIELSEVIETYKRMFYAFDPFFHHWREVGEEGVFRLRSLASDLWRTRYAREFLRPAAIYDEIAVFLPKIGDASPTLILDRATGNFSEAETDRVRALYPLLASLHRRHLSLLDLSNAEGNASPLGFVGPCRMLDQHGQTVLVSKAWKELVEAGDADLANAVEAIGTKGPCAVSVSHNRILRRTRLPNDFGPAPNGYFDELVATRQEFDSDSTWRLPAAMGEKLTKRENQIVELTLKGYPIIEIAKRLGIGRGTVKNYRYRIYEKFDITTERELFIEYNRQVMAG